MSDGYHDLLTDGHEAATRRYTLINTRREQMSSRTFKVRSPHMTGEDITAWQGVLKKITSDWGATDTIKADGKYGIATRDLSASVLHGLGISTLEMAKGITPELRIKVRNKRLTLTERARYAARTGWRAAFVARYAHHAVAPPLAKILSSSWGYHPGVHDGVDLICNPDATLYALCDATVVDVRSSGWWGLGAPSDPDLKAKGDGIIQLESRVTCGPFRPGQHFAYGHAEHATVHVGQVVKAGTVIGKAGFANAWHVHFMVNGGSNTRGIGDRDPMPYVNYAMTH